MRGGKRSGAGRKKVAAPRTVVRAQRWSELEWREICARAAAAGHKPPNDFVRQQLLGGTPAAATASAAQLAAVHQALRALDQALDQLGPAAAEQRAAGERQRAGLAAAAATLAALQGRQDA